MNQWADCILVQEWWYRVIAAPNNPYVPLMLLVILVTWDLWCERNTRIFRNKAMTPTSLIGKIKRWTLW